MTNQIAEKCLKIKHQAIKIPVILDLRCDLTEIWMVDLLAALLPEAKGTFLDIGVNLGQTLIKVKGIECDRPYIGFEPNPTCVFYTKELIKANQFSDCTIVPVGLFTEDGILALECIGDSEVDSAASLIQGFRPNHVIQRRILVPVFRFETIAPSLNLDNRIDNIDRSKIGLIKIDVEGAELEVIQSLESLLKCDRPIVLLEVLPAYSADNTMRRDRQEALERLFQAIDYSFFRVAKTADNEFAGLQKIDAIGIHADLTQCDYVVVPKELNDRIQAAVITTSP